MESLVLFDRNSQLSSEDSNSVNVPVTSNNKIINVNDERGCYNIAIFRRITVNYIIIEILGEGGFSQVVSAYDLNEGIAVAIKIFKLNHYEIYKEFYKEVKMLNYVKSNCTESTKELFLEIRDFFVQHKFPCIVTELLGPSLWYRLTVSCKFKLDLPIVQNVARCLVKGLSVLKRLKIVHRDLKPDNILFTSCCSYSVKIVDFGCAYFENDKPKIIPQARSFKAPEVILDLPYHYESDMWALGCTLALISTGIRFVRGLTDEEVLTNIIKVLGIPPASMVQQSPVAKRYFVNGTPRFLKMEPVIKKSKREKRVKKQKQPNIPGSRYFDDLLVRSNSFVFVDFLKSCLTYEPKGRMTPDEALEHPWLSKYSFS